MRPFQHDQMKSMKGFPKLFFIQACHGTVYAKAAVGSTSKPKAQQLLPTEDDQMVWYSVTGSNFSIVCDTRGSLFIIEVVKAFKKYYKTLEDIREIMREAEQNIAHNCKWRYEANGKHRKCTIQYKFKYIYFNISHCNIKMKHRRSLNFHWALTILSNELAQ